MHKGRIQQADTALEIYRRPNNRFVADFIGRANFLPVDNVERTAAGWTVRFQDVNVGVPAAADTLGSGQRGLLMVRPESIRLAAIASGKPSGLTGCLARTSYLGSQVEYELDMAGQRLLAIRFDPGVGDVYPPGTEVQVELVEENAFCCRKRATELPG